MAEPFGNFDFRARAEALGNAVAEHGPGVILDEVETLLPDNVRDVVRTFPMLAVVAGVGLGVWLGANKREEVISAGTALVSAAVMATVSQTMDRGQ